MSIEPNKLSDALKAVETAIMNEPTTGPVTITNTPRPSIQTIDGLLNERGKTHGEYSVHAEITQALKATMQSGKNWGALTPVQKETLEMVAHKIGRILAGNPNVKDHWDDMAGYAKLAADRVR